MNSPVRTPGDLVVTRSLMFVPGSKQRMIDKSVAMRNLDVAMYDIEDGVAPEGVPEGRWSHPTTPSRSIRCRKRLSEQTMIEHCIEQQLFVAIQTAQDVHPGIPFGQFEGRPIALTAGGRH